jgi:predicted flap endonuclease-1-like 5' DNA nuclease
LPGQEDLAARKGDWKYEGEAAKPKAKTKAKAKPKKAAPAKPDMSEDYDKDGKLEGAAEGAKPATLTAPRGGKADNLKEIKGVGPKMEKMLNDMGFYHFDQIAAWSADETAWVNANLAGFKGRVTRDNWVEQAKILAAGGETEFSKRVDKGGVY